MFLPAAESWPLLGSRKSASPGPSLLLDNYNITDTTMLNVFTAKPYKTGFSNLQVSQQ